MVLELEQADVAVAEPHRQYDNAHDIAGARLETAILSGVGNDHRLPGLERQATHSHADFGRLLRRREKAKRRAPRQLWPRRVHPEHSEFTPVDETMRQRLDPQERIGKTHVRRYDLLHGEDLIQLLRRDGLLEDALHEDADDNERRADEHPPNRTDRADRRQYHRDGDQSSTEADHLIAQDERLLFLEQLIAPEQTEIQQRPAEDEIRQREEGKGRQSLRRHARRMRRACHHGRPGKEAVGAHERDDFAPSVDPARLGALPKD